MYKELHNTTNFCLISLSVSNIMVTVTVVPVVVNLNHFGGISCNIGITLVFFLPVHFTASVSNLILIAIDRYRVVMHPHGWKLKGKWAMRAISAVWLISVCYSGVLHPIKTKNARKPQILMTPKLQKTVDSAGSTPLIMEKGETENITSKMSTTVMFDLRFEDFGNKTSITSAQQQNDLNSSFVLDITKEMDSNLSSSNKTDLEWLLLPCVSNLITRRILTLIETLIWFILPFGIMAGIYVTIIRKLWRANGKMNNSLS